MLVKEVRKINDRKRKVLFEDGFSFVLYSAEIHRFQIRSGEDVPEEVIRQICEEILKKRSRLRCLNLLKTSDRTVSWLKERLMRDGYPEEITQQALDYAASFHYTDDLRYTRNYIRQCAGRKSIKQIEYELINKGVDRETVRAALLEAREQDSDFEAEAIRALARKRGFDPEQAGREEYAKFVRHLSAKGFGMETIRRVTGHTPA